MKKMLDLRIPVGKDKVDLFFGIAEESDIKDVYELRYKVYNRKGYIDESKYPNKLEIDDYDKLGKSTHIIVKTNTSIIGCIRIIVDNLLPTQKLFSFEEPFRIKDIPAKNRWELGRFIIVPPDKGVYLPRGLVMLFMFKVLVDLGKEHNIAGGYSFIKKSLRDKLEKRNFPINIIEQFSRNDINEDYPLYKYFSQQHDPVVPAYFITDDFQRFIENKLENKLILIKKDNHSFELRNSLLFKIIKMLNIL